MPLDPMPPSSVNCLIKTMLAGDITAAGLLLKELTGTRPEDARWLGSQLGALAVAAYRKETKSELPDVVLNQVGVDEAAEKPLTMAAWREFSNAVKSYFHLDLYTLDSTLASLNDSLRKRSRVSVDFMEAQ